jgi:hypothetical protein
MYMYYNSRLLSRSHHIFAPWVISQSRLSFICVHSSSYIDIDLFDTGLSVVVSITAYVSLDVLFLARGTDSSHKTFDNICMSMVYSRKTLSHITLHVNHQGTVIADIPKSGSETEGARLLVLNATLQVRVSEDSMYTVWFDIVFPDW